MRTKRFDSEHAKRILTGMIVHDDILSRIHQHVGDDLRPFNQRWLDLVAGWCFKHFKRYGKAPKGAIQTLFHKHASSATDDESTQIIEKFLATLSDDYRALKREMNQDFIVDLAAEHFKKVRLRRVAEEIDSAIEAGDLEEAEKKYASYKPIQLATEAHEDPFSKQAIIDTFKKVKSSESLIHWPGSMDRFLSPHFKREGFIAFCGPEKRGKSFWLLETVWQALKQKRKVLYYVFGDMPKHEVYQRLYCRMLRRPWKTETLHIPKGIRITGENRRSGVAKMLEEERKGLTPRDVWLARRKMLKITASKKVNLKVKTCGGYMMSASDIEREVEQFSDREDWEADLVVIDYADLLLPEPDTKRLDVRHQINLSWMILRRIGISRHCLVVTGTQAAATAYEDKWVIRKGDFSEDKRKNAHVTGMLGINQTSEEKEQGVYRLNWIDLRGGKWSENQCLWTAGNLSLSCPCIVSAL